VYTQRRLQVVITTYSSMTQREWCAWPADIITKATQKSTTDIIISKQNW